MVGVAFLESFSFVLSVRVLVASRLFYFDCLDLASPKVYVSPKPSFRGLKPTARSLISKISTRYSIPLHCFGKPLRDRAMPPAFNKEAFEQDLHDVHLIYDYDAQDEDGKPQKWRYEAWFFSNDREWCGW